MFDLVLVHPQIPQNTGNIIRLCANTGVRLHLVRPLGFRMADRDLRRAGLDYHEFADVAVHDTFEDWQAGCAGRCWAFSRHAVRPHHEVAFSSGDALILGSETSGLPADVLARIPVEQRLRIPMREGSRSLNLANAAAVAVYEAWRQAGFGGAA